MKYFKLSSLSFYKNLGINILFIFEILVLLLAVNVTVASDNGKKEITRVLDETLTHEGYMIWYYPYGGKESFSRHPDYKVVNEKNSDLQNFYALFKGDTVVREFKKSSIGFNNQNEFLDYQVNYRTSIEVIVLDDDIFEKLGFTLKSGSYPSAITNENYVEAIITPNEFGFETNKILSANDFFDGEDYRNPKPLPYDIRISGTLTNNTYLIFGENWKSPMSIDQLFETYTWTGTEYRPYMYMSKSSAEKLNLYIYSTPISYIYYNSEPTAEERAYNDSLISFMRECGADIITLDEFTENSQSYFNNISRKVTPIIIIVTIIILIGLISSTAINTNLQLDDYSIYFLCGANWKSCINIVILNLMKISFVALILNIIILQLGEILFNINGQLGLSYGLNNVIMTLGAIAFVVILSCLIPYFIIKRNSPIEIFRDNKV